MKTNISMLTRTLKHLPHYHFYLQQLKRTGREFVSIERLAADLRLTAPEVRRDLENLHESLGVGEIHSIDKLIGVVERSLGYDQHHGAILAGAGNLGRAMINYQGFRACGLNILAIFDHDPTLVGSTIGEQEVFHIDRLEHLALRLRANIGIITTPPEPAQRIAGTMVDAGIQGIWNFSQAILKVPGHVMLRNTSLYSDYLRLIQTL